MAKKPSPKPPKQSASSLTEKAPVAEKKLSNAEIIEQLRKVLADAGSSGYLLVVADSQGAIGSWVAAANYGDLALLGHFGQKEVSRQIDNAGSQKK